MQQFLQEGPLGWFLAAITLFTAMATLINSMWPTLERIWQWWKGRKDPNGEGNSGSGGIADNGKLKIRMTRFVLGLVLLGLSVAIFQYITQLPSISVSEDRTNAAWHFFKRGEPDPVRNRPASADALRQAIRIADTVVNDLAGAANTKQKALIQDKMPVPPTGEVPSEQRKTILAYGPLNDVATCLWIKARSLELLGQTNQAIELYHTLTNYPHARTWDPKGWFWSPMEDALGRLSAYPSPGSGISGENEP